MRKKAIPDDVREKVEEIVDRFNKNTFRSGDCYYEATFRGKHFYLNRCDYGKTGPICRFTYNGKMDNWEFAIFKWSTETYDSDEWMFPGSGEIDGTVDGAMMAGLQAYPA